MAETKKDKNVEQWLPGCFNNTIKYLDKGTDGAYLLASVNQYLVDCDAPDPDSSPENFYDPTHIELFLFTCIAFTFLVPFAVLAQRGRIIQEEKTSLQSNEETGKNQLFPWLAWAYPYMRDLLSGLKNGRHALLNPTQLITTNFYGFFNPIGIALGVFLAVNLILIRRINENRKEKNKANIDLLNSPNAIETLTADQFNATQYSTLDKSRNYAMVVVDAVTDGFYLYGNLVLAFALFGVTFSTAGIGGGVILGVALLITLSSLASKISQERKEQRKFDINALDIKIRYLKGKEDKKNEIKEKKNKLKSLIIEEKGCFLKINQKNQKYHHNHNIEGTNDKPVYELLFQNGGWQIKKNEKIVETPKEVQNLLNSREGKEQFTPDEIKKIEQAIAKNFPNQSVLYFAFRGLLSGFKNGSSAIGILGYFFPAFIINFFALSASCLYASYLSGKEWVEGNKKGESPYAFGRLQDVGLFSDAPPNENTSTPPTPTSIDRYQTCLKID